MKCEIVILSRSLSLPKGAFHHMNLDKPRSLSPSKAAYSRLNRSAHFAVRLHVILSRGARINAPRSEGSCSSN
jgi:hypothetical protein